MKLTGQAPSPTVDLLQGNDAGAGYTPRNMLVAVLFFVAYVGLDWVSNIDAFHHFHISPWSPAPALGFLYLLGRGPGGPFVLYLALAAGDFLVRGLFAHVAEILFLNLTLTLCYLCMTELLRRYTADGGMFVDVSSLTKWIAIVTVGSVSRR